MAKRLIDKIRSKIFGIDPDYVKPMRNDEHKRYPWNFNDAKYNHRPWRVDRKTGEKYFWS